jgi:C1A family cysteine protease
MCIHSGFPVVIGIDVYESFEDNKSIETGIIPMPDVNTEKLLGGHCVSLWGFDDNLGSFLMMNSWGVSVGNQGWFEIPYSYVENSNLANSFYSPRYFK